MRKAETHTQAAEIKYNNYKHIVERERDQQRHDPTAMVRGGQMRANCWTLMG